MVAVVTQDTRLINAKNFEESFSEKHKDRAYVFIGKKESWQDDVFPPVHEDSTAGQISLWKNFIAAKLISSNNFIRVIKRFDWTSGQIYSPFDDAEQDIVNRTYPLYVFTDEGNVYKCIDAPGNNIPSTVKPSGTSLSIFQTSDGYSWKYMYSLSVTEINEYTTNNWIPVKTLKEDNGSSQWDVQTAAIDGGIHKIDVVDQGTGYSSATVTITSDTGTGATATADVSNGKIQSITVTDPGTGYRDAVVTISGDGINATAKATLSPTGGHGSDPIKELNGIYTMVKVQMTDDEGGDFPVNISFRTIGVVINPKINQLGTRIKVSGIGAANDFLSEDTITGLSSSATGTVSTWDYENKYLYLKDVTGSFSTNETIKNQNNLSSTVDEITNNVNLFATDLTYSDTEIKKYEGRIVYVENRQPIERNTGQTEDVRLVIEF